MKKEHLELAVILSRHGPMKDPNIFLAADVAEIARKLIREAAGQTRLSVDLCNGAVSQEFYAQCKAARKIRIDVLLAYTGVRAELGGDPRGYVLKLFSTTKKPLPHNSWGGAESGWGVG